MSRYVESHKFRLIIRQIHLKLVIIYNCFVINRNKAVKIDMYYHCVYVIDNYTIIGKDIYIIICILYSKCILIIEMYIFQSSVV